MTASLDEGLEARDAGTSDKAQPPNTSQRPAGSVRKKRGAYISKACHECRRRKSKCEGQKPCARCTKHDLACVFSPYTRRNGLDDDDPSAATRILQQKVAFLEEQLRASNAPALTCQSSPKPASSLAPHPGDHEDDSSGLTSATSWPQQEGIEPLQTVDANILNELPANPTNDDHMEALPAALPPTAFSSTSNRIQYQQIQSPGFVQASATSSPYSVQQHGSLAGDSSTHTAATAHYKYNLSLAQTHLAARGISDSVEQVLTSTMPTREPSPLDSQSDKHRQCDPLWLIDKTEALRLCGVFEEEIGKTYPFLDIDKISSHVSTVYTSLDVGRRSGFAYLPLRDDFILPADDLKIIKMVLACALVIETSGSSALSRTLFHNVRDSIQGPIWGDVTITSITVYTLCAIWLFLADNDFLAWRITGIVARWCLELGLNQSLYLHHMLNNDQERKMVVRLFWCIQTLDRRWSFGSGLPFVIRDEDIDQSFPPPDDEVPYLKAMVKFSSIVSDVWHAVYSTPVDATTRKGQETVSYLEYRISKWWDELPVTLQFGKGDLDWSRGTKRQRILLYLRKCQLTILLQQPVLHCSSRIRQRPEVARAVVRTAKDVIRKLDDLNRTTDIYQTQQMCFNHFLVTSLGVIFLAVSQAPGEFATSVRGEFNAALDLVQQLSLNSFVSKRLWKAIRGLRQMGDRLGVSPADVPQNEATSARNEPRPIGNNRPGPTFDPGLFLLEQDLQFPFMATDDPIDGAKLTENMNAVFEAMEKDQENFSLDLPLEAGGAADAVNSHVDQWHDHSNRNFDDRNTAYGNQDVSRLLVSMIGGT